MVSGSNLSKLPEMKIQDVAAGFSLRQPRLSLVPPVGRLSRAIIAS
jgi:hypothetical protein